MKKILLTYLRHYLFKICKIQQKNKKNRLLPHFQTIYYIKNKTKIKFMCNNYIKIGDDNLSKNSIKTNQFLILRNFK